MAVSRPDEPPDLDRSSMVLDVRPEGEHRTSSLNHRRLARTSVRAIAVVLHLVLAWGLCSLAIVFVSDQGGALTRDGFALRYVPLAKNPLSTRTYALTRLPPAEILSVSVRLREGPPAALVLISDYDARGFQCLRLSTIPSLPSGILDFREGKPTAFVPLQPERDDPLLYRVRFGRDSLARPLASLDLMTLPPGGTPASAASEMRFESNTGSDAEVPLRPHIAWWLSALPGLAFGLLLLSLDRRRVEKHHGSELRRRVRQQIALWRGFGLVASGLLLFKGFGILSTPNTPTYFVYLLVICLFLLLGLFGGYRIPGTGTKQTRTTKRGNWLLRGVVLASLLPFFLHGVFLIWYQGRAVDRFENEHVFRGRKIERQYPGQPVVLCLGGSSTEGSPFTPEWPYDYPRQLESRLAEVGLGALVANGGIIATTSEFAAAKMAGVLVELKPEVVTINYLNNDGSGSLAGTLFLLLEKIGLTSFEGRFEQERQQHIRRLVRIIREHGAACVLVLEPHFDFVYFDRDPFPLVRGLLREIAEQEGVLLVDPTPAFRREKDRFLFVDSNVHLTRYGHELLAQVLVELIGPLLSGAGSKAVSPPTAATAGEGLAPRG